MAFLEIPNVRISGVSACVPKNIESNWTSDLIPENERTNLIEKTGIEEKRVSLPDICTSDLCYSAADSLIEEMNCKSEIDAIVFVSQSPDYILPATAPILQHRLGLSQECMALDVSLGCSGWVYGLSVISALVANGKMRKALLLAGDPCTRTP